MSTPPFAYPSAATGSPLPKGLIADWDAPTLLGTYADGAGVSGWIDSTRTYTASQANVDKQPTFSKTGWSDGGPCVQFNQAATHLLECDPIAAAMSGQPGWTVAALCRRSSLAQDQIICAPSDGVASGCYVDFDFVTLAPNNGALGWYPGVATATQLWSFSDEDSLAVMSNPSANALAWIQGQSGQANYGDLSASTWTRFGLGGMFWNNTIHPRTFDGTIRRLLVFNRAFASQDHAQLVKALGLQAMMRFGAFVLGDSISLDNGIGGSQWPVQRFWTNAAVQYTPSSRAVAARAYHYNSSVAARTLVTTPQSGANNELDNLAADLYGQYVADMPMLVFLMLGTNDVYYGADGATATARYWQVCDAIRANCPRAYLVAMPPLNRGNWSTAPNYGGSDAPYNSAQATFQANVRSGFASHADALVDFSVLPQMADPTSATYFADKCHPTQAGQNVCASVLNLTQLQLAAANKVLSALGAV